MASVNKVMIMGHLGKDPELRYTSNQIPVCSITVATSEYKGGNKGERHTEWHKVVVWNKQAENVSKYLKKGSGVFLEGRLRTRSWDDQNTGQKRYSTEIVAHSVQFLPRSGQQSSHGSGDYSEASMPSVPGVDHGGGFPGAYSPGPGSSPMGGSMNQSMSHGMPGGGLEEQTPQLPVIEDDEVSITPPVPGQNDQSSSGLGQLPF